MADEIHLYISASPDLALEREVLGRATTEIPVSLGWRIKQTPTGRERLDLQAAARADLHILLMGADVRAPIGAEWLAAQRAGRIPMLFLKQGVVHTPAGEVFIHDLERQARWRTYKDISDLRRQVLMLIAGHILDNADHYALSPEEFVKLRNWRQELEAGKDQPVDQTQAGAGASSVVLSPERYIPTEGKLVTRKSRRGPRS